MPLNENQAFVDAFADYTDYYVLIGGTAASILLSENGLESRTTKDYDMVLIDHKKNEAFYNVLKKFLEDGSYTPSNLDEKGKLFRFTTENENYPKMIELFSNIPNIPLAKEGRTTPCRIYEFICFIIR